MHWAPATKVSRGGLTVEDCRRIFTPLTALTTPATAQAIHVTNVSWANDDVITLDQLIASGLRVTLDQAPSGPVTGANFAVTVESFINPVTAQREVTALAPAFAALTLPATLLRGVTVVDSEIVTKGTVINWLLPFDQANRLQLLTIGYLNTLISTGAPAKFFARVRVRILGRAVFAAAAAGPSTWTARRSAWPRCARTA